MPIKHGESAYNRNICRCEVCTSVASQAAMARRRLLREQPIPDEMHGTLNAYQNRACRCALCREAQRLYIAAYRKSRRCDA